MAKRATSQKPQEVALYARVSTRRQGVEGVSLEHQFGRLRAESSMRFPGARQVEYSDIASGRREGRESYQAMMADVRSGRFVAVLAWDVDRLARCASDFARCLAQAQRTDTALVLSNLGLIGNTAIGRLVIGLLSHVAEFESSHLSERMVELHAETFKRRLKGPGSRPFGWRVDDQGALIAAPDEQRAVDLVLHGRSQGRTWASLCEDVTKIGVAPVAGGSWSPPRLRSCVMACADRRARLATL